MRGGIYARFSSDNQNPISIQDQILACQRYAERQGWDIPSEQIYVDEALSGIGIAHRPGYQQLLRALESSPPPFQILLVDDLSRLSRDAAEILRIVRFFQGNGLTLISVADGIETGTKLSKLVISVKAVMNELYVDDLRDRTLRGMQGRFARGQHTGGRIFGYCSVPDIDPNGRLDSSGNPLTLGVQLQIDPEEANIVRAIFTWFTEGWGLRRIAHQLNGDHVPFPAQPTRRGSKRKGWAGSGVRVILKNEKYRGQWVWGRRMFVKDPVSGRRRVRLRPESEWQIAEHPHLRIISDDLWSKAQTRFCELGRQYPTRQPQGRLNGKHPGSPSTNPTLFSGLLQCGVCGGQLIVVSGGAKTPNGRFGCSTHRNKGSHVCANNLTVKVVTVETQLVAAIRGQVFHPSALEYVTTVVNRYLQSFTEVVEDQKGKIATDLKRVERELQNIERAILSGVIGETTATLLKEREAQRAALQHQLADIQTHEPANPAPIDKDVIKERLYALLETLKQDPTRVNAFFREHLSPISCTPVQKKERRYYRARGASNMENLMKSLGLGRNFVIGGCGGGI